MFTGAERTSDGHDTAAIPPAASAPVRRSARRESCFAVNFDLCVMEASAAGFVAAGIDKSPRGEHYSTARRRAMQVTCLKERPP